MNNNTTILLALVCAVLAAGFFYVRGREADRGQQAFTAPPNPAAQISQNLLDEDARLGDAVRVEIERPGKDTIVFEKDDVESAGVATWHLTAPIDMKVRSYEAEGFARDVNELAYDVSYLPGEPGAVTAEDAGLNPPVGRVTVEDAEGKKVTVEVGKKVSATDRYVRLAGADRICVAKTDPFRSLKTNLVEYRDSAVWSFAPDDATRIEVTDRTAEGRADEYVFVKDKDAWTMASPLAAPTTDKVADMLRTVSNLRATKWEADAPDSLAAYGLDPATTTVKITVEKQVPLETDADDESNEDDENEGESAEEKPVETKTETRTFVLHLSDRSPIGEDTKTYMRVGDETLVATILKSTADKIKPVMAEWRDMRITTAAVDTASRVTIEVAGEKAAFTKGADGWTFESDQGAVEASPVTELLAAVKALRAVAFVETEGDDLSEYGLTDPRATVAVTVPGLESPLRLAVGNHTEDGTKRLIFLRKNDATSIAKVRTADVDALLKKPVLYRNREIFSLAAEAITTIRLKRAVTVGTTATEVAFEKRDGAWRMTAPVDAEADTTKLTELAATLSSFKARAVVADAGEASAFGLHSPTVEATALTGPEGEGERLSVSFAATEHDGKYYLKRVDRPTIYEIAGDDYKRWTAEFRATRLFDVAADDVTSFRLTRDDTEQGFVRRDQKWSLEAEPDLPLDQEKVAKLLDQVLQLEAAGFARHTTGHAAEFGLDNPVRTISLTLLDGATRRLDVSAQSDTALGSRAFFASTPSRPGVVLLAESALSRVAVDLDDLEAK